MAEQGQGTEGPSSEQPELSEPIRRRVRAALLRGLVHSAGVLPPGVLSAALRPLSRLAFRHRYGRTIASNLTLTLPRIEELDPKVAARLTSDPSAFTREVADFVAEQAAHWIRLAHGAAPDTEQGAWIEDLVEIDPSIERLDAVLAEGRGAISSRRTSATGSCSPRGSVAAGKAAPSSAACEGETRVIAGSSTCAAPTASRPSRKMHRRGRRSDSSALEVHSAW